MKEVKYQLKQIDRWNDEKKQSCEHTRENSAQIGYHAVDWKIIENKNGCVYELW